MKNSLLLRMAGVAALILLYIRASAQVPELKINDKVDPQVYLSKLSIDVKVIGNRAVTTMTMVFTNKSNRLLEGELVFPLPEGVSVSRYALDINGRLREAVPVEKEKATQVFEEIERRQVDPGILEQVEGNNFRTRIYPITARGSRTILIGYEEELSLNNNRSLRYHLALDHKSPVEQFKLDLAVVKSRVRPEIEEEPDEELSFKEWNNNYTASITKENFIPGKPLTVTIPRPADVADVLMQKAGANYYFLVNSFPKAETRARKQADDIAIVWDASLSGLTRNTKKDLELLKRYIQRKKDLQVSLYLLNNNFRKSAVYTIKNGDWNLLKSALESIIYDGGTDYSKLQFTGHDEYLFFSDGMSSLGVYDPEHATGPVYTIVSSPRADYSYLQLIAQKTGGAYINQNGLTAAEADKLLTQESLQFLGIKPDPRVSETYPSVPVPVINTVSVAGMSTEPNAEITLQFGYGTTVVFEKTVTLNFENQDAGDADLARAWAQKKIAELDTRYETNREMITFLGKRFSIVTRNTSLIVLETVQDYVRYEIDPPAELRQQYDQIMKGTLSQRQSRQHMAMSSALSYLDLLASWWDKNYVPGTRVAPKPPVGSPNSAVPDNRSDTMAFATAPVQSREVRRENDTHRTELQEVVVTGYGTQRKRDISGAVSGRTMEEVKLSTVLQGKVSGVEVQNRRRSKAAPAWRDEDPVRNLELSRGYFNNLSTGSVSIDVKQWTPDRVYLKEIAKEKKANQYNRYLVLREQYLNSPTFFYDMAQFFFNQQDTIIALQILTNIAEIDIENHELFKLLGYKLRETGQYEEAVFIFKKVLQWRPMEPQSYRDYGLALADAHKYQQAVDTFYTALKKNYEEGVAGLYRGFEEILVTEMNRIIAQHKDEINTSSFDMKLIHAMPVDVRVVLSWNKNNTDMDLWVIDPNGDKCYYGHKETLIGGRISNDFTRGYGPEQFLLKKAIPGKYQVLVNYYGDRQVKISGPPTVMAEIFTHYADGREARKIITMQMEQSNRSEGVLVGEFAFAR